MLSNIVLVISLLFFLVEGAKYKVVSNDKLRRKLSKEDKIKAVTQLKEHIASVTGKGKRRIQEVKHLESFNEYDSSYSSEMWTNVNTYGAANCSGAVSMADATYNSICQVGTFITNIQVEDSDNVTYYSARTLFTSDCASKTAVFYASDDCSDTPAKQGNMQSTGLTTAGVCDISEDNDDDESIDFVSEKVSCTSSAEVFLWGAIQKKEYQQTTTCQGDPFNIAYIMGGCYKTTGGGSIYYAAPFAYAGGPTLPRLIPSIVPVLQSALLTLDVRMMVKLMIMMMMMMIIQSMMLCSPMVCSTITYHLCMPGVALLWEPC